MKYIFLLIFIAILVVFHSRYSHKTFILNYHKIDNFQKGGLKSLFVRPGYFNLQMKYLSLRGYKTISLKQLISILKEKREIPKKVFVITFDDGYKNNYTNAYPILKKYNFIATIFLTTGNIGRSVAYPGEPPEAHLNIDEIKQMKDIVDYGAHTVNHIDLTTATKNIADYEIIESKKIIEQKINMRIETFCYPFGRYNDYAIELVKKNYSGACSSKSALVDKDSNVYLLPRVEFKDILTMTLRDFFKFWEFYLKILLGF